MILAGENDQALRIISRVRDSTVKDEALLAMIPQLTMPDAPVDPLLKEVGAIRSQIEAYAEAASLSTRSESQQRADLDRALTLYHTGGKEVKIEQVAVHLIQPLTQRDLVDEVIKVNSRLEERRYFEPKALFGSTSQSSAAGVASLITALAETDSELSEAAESSVRQLAERGPA